MSQPLISPTILICTVGGAHEPILTAIRQTTPRFVCFICSGKDPATGRAGSDVQITGKGSIIKKSFIERNLLILFCLHKLDRCAFAADAADGSH
jgi:hypothetical protein